MISNQCSIEEFVEAVKEMDSREVITLAIQEATAADRIVLKKRKQAKIENFETYSRQLKQLIGYHRYSVKLRRRPKTTYNLYIQYWGDEDHANDMLTADSSLGTVDNPKGYQEIVTRKHT